jgi:hypothetical protein
MCGSNPEVNFSINCEQHQFYEKVKKLRYDDADPSSSAKAISFFETLTTKLFTDLKYLTINEKDTGSLHIRLVASPIELAQIPFEFALAPANISNQGNEHLLTHPERLITLTREVRQETEARYSWPHTPRILFAWAEPTQSVPHQEQRAALVEVLEPLAKPRKDIPSPEADIETFLTELPHASLQALGQEIAKAIAQGRPYTHVNILAHGEPKVGISGVEFRLILCKEGSIDQATKVNGEKLIKAIIPEKTSSTPIVVSLSACDSGNAGTPIIPSGSLVYQLHNAGIPCVFASQFPLTQAGSIVLVKTLYHQLINACDPRVALYETRMALKYNQTHDWASLLVYARFPEDINQQLQETRLKMLFGSMRTTNTWVDHVFRYKEKIPEEKREQALKGLENRLTNSISELSAYLNNNEESNLETTALRSEHFGLLGSAYKRKAEYLYRLIEFEPQKKANLIDQSCKDLENAKLFYKKGFEANSASHWNGMQYLSLKGVKEGSLKADSDLWTVIKFMAQVEEQNAQKESDRIWAWGTLAELYLLKPLTVPGNVFKEEITSALVIAKGFMTKIANASTAHNAAKESTARQFERYINWWPALYPGTYPTEIKDMAIVLRSILPSLEVLL